MHKLAALFRKKDNGSPSPERTPNQSPVIEHRRRAVSELLTKPLAPAELALTSAKERDGQDLESDSFSFPEISRSDSPLDARGQHSKPLPDSEDYELEKIRQPQTPNISTMHPSTSSSSETVVKDFSDPTSPMSPTLRRVHSFGGRTKILLKTYEPKPTPLSNEGIEEENADPGLVTPLSNSQNSLPSLDDSSEDSDAKLQESRKEMFYELFHLDEEFIACKFQNNLFLIFFQDLQQQIPILKLKKNHNSESFSSHLFGL
jgi:hypothetical protein